MCKQAFRWLLKLKVTAVFTFRNLMSVRYTLDQVVWVRALAGVLSWTRYFTLTLPLSTLECKWVVANCWSKQPGRVLESINQYYYFPPPPRGGGSNNTPSHFMLQKSGLSNGSYVSVGLKMFNFTRAANHFFTLKGHMSD